jgi:hypothetical protein
LVSVGYAEKAEVVEASTGTAAHLGARAVLSEGSKGQPAVWDQKPTRPSPRPVNGGPPSGFLDETHSLQSHNVPATLPSNDGYSPLWSVNVYDNVDFPKVRDLDSVLKAKLLAPGVATVNCPIVSITP